jgi:hypothetical protein
MISRQKSLFFLLFSFFALTAGAQEFYRIKADFSIKEKESGQAQGNLITGTVYYDKNLGKTNYNVRFPEPESWWMQDTFMYRMVKDTLAAVKKIAPFNEYSFFHLILNQQLTDFGLSKAGYEPGEVTQEGRQVLSTWNPPAQLAKLADLGPVVIAQENKRLTGIAFQDKNGKVLGKFYLQEYQVLDGLPVPTKIYQVYYKETTEFIRLISFKNIQINALDEADRYDFRLPDGH